MHPHGQQGSTEQQPEHVPAEVVHHKCIEGHLHSEVDQLSRLDRKRVDEERSERVEERLHEHPHSLHERVGEVLRFELARNVRVDHIVALVSVVFEVVLLKADRHRQANRKVRNHAPDFVQQHTILTERLSVRDLVHGQHQAMINHTSEEICDQKQRPKAL